MRVFLDRPSMRDEVEFLSLVRASRSLHRPWVYPPFDRSTFRRYVTNSRKSDQVSYFIRVRKSGALVGVVNFNNIVRGGLQCAFLGFYGFSTQARLGLMTEGLFLAVSRAFGEHRLHRIEANVQPANVRSRELVRRLGFTREGFSERYLKVGGRWRDHERWALRVEQWRAKRRRGRLAA